MSRFHGRQFVQPCRGFTLVEVMVALTVLSLILVATVAALRTFGNTQVSLERATQRVDELRTVSSFLRTQFESAALGYSSQGGLSLGGASEESAYFSGTANAMVWRATIKFGESYGGKHLLRVIQQGSDLVLQWQDGATTTFDLSWDGKPSRRLVANIEEFSLAYKISFASNWTTTIDQGVIPALVRVRIKTRDRYWPDLIMEVLR
ncbi:MAG: type II secretion system protein J [Parahaliea sp.]